MTDERQGGEKGRKKHWGYSSRLSNFIWRVNTGSQSPEFWSPHWGAGMDAGQILGASWESHSSSDNPVGSGAAVDLCVFGQVIAAGKLLLTQRTLVRLNARVWAAVARQLIGPGEPGETRAAKAGGWTTTAADGDPLTPTNVSAGQIAVD